MSRLYYEKGMAPPEIARKLAISKQTVHYWLERIENPIPRHLRTIVGSKRIVLSAADVDLLPFVDPAHLRWAARDVIVMRYDNSRRAIISRFVKAQDFFRLAGFYLAEGAKTKQRALVTNTNFALIGYYLKVVKSIVRSRVMLLDIHKGDRRKPQKGIGIGGRCLKDLFLNAIEGMLGSLSNSEGLNGQLRALGLAFLNGCSDGDAGVQVARQRRSDKFRAVFYITEGREIYASRLVKVFKVILGVGSTYKPRKRNYFLVQASLSPDRAALLLTSGFFRWHASNMGRLGRKALDSAYLSRYTRLFSLFGSNPFSRRDLDRLAPDMSPDFVGRSVGTGFLLPIGVARTPNKNYHWCRSYKLSTKGSILAKLILESTRGLTKFKQQAIEC